MNKYVIFMGWHCFLAKILPTMELGKCRKFMY